MSEVVTLGGGCFWCIEAVMNQLKGVESAVSGYSGGESEHPTYEQVSSGRTGYAEVSQVTFDPAQLPLHDLLTIFFTLHNPTTKNRQGNDVGTQYRSVIFYHSEEQKGVAEAVMQEIAELRVWPDPLVTDLVPFQKFYPAENYHQHYYELHPEQGYCQAIIAPKVAKLREKYLPYLKNTSTG